ncbi:MAG: SGNH/GDSL hydrolase family protein [Ruthenibacterium sp.]
MPDAASFDRRMAEEHALSDEPICWYDIPAEPIAVRGLGYFEKEQKLCRLPAALLPKLAKVRSALCELATHTAGAQLRFCTDSPEVFVRAELSGSAYMGHMTACAQCGFDCYLRFPQENRWIFAGVTRFPIEQKELCCRLAADLPDGNVEVQINLPLYIGVQRVSVGVRMGSSVFSPCKEEKAIAFYGTSITQGGCATRSGMAYPAIVGRRLGVESYNFGFSGNGVGMPLLADAICGVPRLSVLVVDIEPNAAPEGLLEKNLPLFLDAVRAIKPALPILVLAGSYMPRAGWEPAFAAQKRTWRNFQESEVLQRTRKGDVQIHFADAAALTKDVADEATVDGVHLTDLGFYALAKALEPILKKMLANR